MKKQLIVTLASFLIVAAASVAKADPFIAWSAAVNDTGTAADVLTNGTVLGAAADWNGNNYPSTLTVNSVTFEWGGNGYLQPDGTALYASGGSPGTGDSDYNNLFADYATGGRVIIGGLTVGETYQLQIFEPYFTSSITNPGASEFVLTDGTYPNASDLPDPSGPVASGDSTDDGQYVVATFLADFTQMTLFAYNVADPESGDCCNGGGNGVMGSAYILIEDPTSPATPEPGTLLLLGSGLLAVGRFTRRKIAAQTKN